MLIKKVQYFSALLTALIPKGRIHYRSQILIRRFGMLKEFKDFALRGNVMDLAVAVIIGGAFGKIIASLVNDVLMPLIGLLLGGLDFSTLSFKVKDASVNY